MKRSIFLALSALISSFIPSAIAGNGLELLVNKSPTCGCCTEWISHIENSGIKAHAENHDDLSTLKSNYGIAPRYQSCHTAVSEDGYVFEGHVPAKFVQQFLANPLPNAIGLSVPAMPVGSPGMEVGDRFMPYDVMLLMKDGSAKVYAHMGTYQEQF